MSHLLQQTRLKRYLVTVKMFFSLQDTSYEVSNIDGLFENLMETEDGLYCMDYEWVFDFPIPSGFVRYRNLVYFYYKI